LLSKEYARERAKLINPDHNDTDIKPGDPYPFQGGTKSLLAVAAAVVAATRDDVRKRRGGRGCTRRVRRGISGAAPPRRSSGYVRLGRVGDNLRAVGFPAVIAGHTGIGVSQRRAAVRDRQHG